MQDPPAFSPAKPQFPEEELLKCPRCESMNTKFCYYNNYNLSQPRHFCKSCRRYWTKGGALRNIPVGGGTRKKSRRRSSTSKRVNSDPKPEPVNRNRRILEASSSSTVTAPPEGQVVGNGNSGLGDPTHMLDVANSGSNGQFGNIFDDLDPNGSGLKMAGMDGFGEDMSSGLNVDPGKVDGGGAAASGGGNYLQSCEWGNSNGWPDLAIYTSRF